jgi:hypothetical protein
LIITDTIDENGVGNYSIFFMRNFLILFVLIVFSCNSKENKFALPNNIIFKIAQDEYLKKPDQFELKHYISNFNNSKVYQIPLFKLLIHNQYTIYFGIPFEIKNLDVFHARSNQISETSNSYLIDTLYHKIKYIIGKKYIIEEYHNFDRYSSYITFTETLSDSIANLFFRENVIKSRFSY